MASNAVSQNSTNQPGNIVTPVAQNQSAPAALTAPGAGFVSSDQAVRDQVAAMSRQAEAMSTRQAPQAPAPIQTVADLGRPTPAPGPQYTVGQASINPAELPPTTQPVIQSNSVPQQQDYARLLPQTNTTPSGAATTPQDRTRAVVDLARQGMTDPARLQQYLNVSQAGGLPTNYTVEEIQTILAQNPNARPTRTTTTSNNLQQGITDLQNVLTSTQRSIIPSNTLSNLQSALTEANNGVVTSDLATNISSIIGGILENYQTLTLPQLPDYDGQIMELQERRRELSDMMSGNADDPALVQYLAIERENAMNRLAQIQDIQARSQQAYDDQIETNKVADARAQVAMAGARLTGSPVAASYLASVALQGRRALTEITTAQNRAINEAEAAYRKDNIELAIRKIDLAEKRRSQYFELLDKQVSLEQNLYNAQTDRIRLQSDLQDKYLDRRKKEKDAANQSFKDYIEKGIDASVLPEEAFQDWADANGMTPEFAKKYYETSVNASQAKNYEDRLKSFYGMLKDIPVNAKDANGQPLTLSMPTKDGGTMSVARSQFPSNGDYLQVNVEKDGEKFIEFFDKNNPQGGSVFSIKTGDVKPDYEIREDNINGGLLKVDKRTGIATPVITYAGNPDAQQGIVSTHQYVQNSGYGYQAGADNLDVPSNGDIGAFMYAIGQFESGGNYKAMGPTTNRGDRAYGRYQVMGANIPSWTKEVLGRSMTPQEFLNDPQAQDAVARAKMQQSFDKRGNWEDVASIWFSGRPLAGNKSQDVIGTSTPRYVQNVMSIFGKNKPKTTGVAAPPSDNRMYYSVAAKSGDEIKSAIKNGIVEDISPSGQNKDESLIYSVRVRDTDTGNIHYFAGVTNPSMKVNESWSGKNATIGQSTNDGYSQSVYNWDGSPVAPTSSGQDVSKYGNWGSLSALPAGKNYNQARTDLERLRNDVEAGKISLDVAVQQVKNDPKLSQLRSDIVLPDLAGRAQYRQDQLGEKSDQKSQELKDKNINDRYNRFTSSAQFTQYTNALDAYQVIETAAQNIENDPTAGGVNDLAILTAFAKSLDPSTGVKDQEFNNMSSAIGELSRIGQLPKKYLNGERLSPEGRKAFVESAKTQFTARENNFVGNVVIPQIQKAVKDGYDPSEVVPVSILDRVMIERDGKFYVRTGQGYKLIK